MTTTKLQEAEAEAIVKAQAAFERATAPARKKLKVATDMAWDTYYQETATARAKLRADIARAEKAKAQAGKEK